MVLLSPITQCAFECLAFSSNNSLTALSLSLHQENIPWDLSRFPHLSTLKLSLRDQAGDDDDFDLFMPGGRQEWIDAIGDRLHSILVSTRSLNLRHLSISIKHLETSLHLSITELLHCLPPSLKKLSISSPLLTGDNRDLLFPSSEHSPCPLLEEIEILPPGQVQQLSRIEFELMKLAQQLVRDECEKRGINVKLAIRSQGLGFDERSALNLFGGEDW
jgi:hypothetical protein